MADAPISPQEKTWGAGCGLQIDEGLIKFPKSPSGVKKVLKV
jgi:hypothetical protein